MLEVERLSRLPVRPMACPKARLEGTVSPFLSVEDMPLKPLALNAMHPSSLNGGRSEQAEY